jgi:hypothetical protein
MTSESINHLDPCEFAIVRAIDGYVLNVLTGTHDEQLLIYMNLTTPEVTYLVDCCQYGKAGIGSMWDGYEFRPPKPQGAVSWRWDAVNATWVSPIPYPGGPTGDGKAYYWNEGTMDWNEIGEAAEV